MTISKIAELLPPALSLDESEKKLLIEKFTSHAKEVITPHYEGIASQMRKKTCELMSSEESGNRSYALTASYVSELELNEGCARIVKALIKTIEKSSGTDVALISIFGYSQEVVNRPWSCAKMPSNANWMLNQSIENAFKHFLA